MSELITYRKDCRICGYSKLQLILSFGSTPLANAFLHREQLNEPELFFPLNVWLCTRCGLVQLRHVVSPRLLFSNYLYASSTSVLFRDHFEDFATDVTRRYRLDEHSFVIDIGSNDGILLSPFKARGVRVLGIEPARAMAKVARQAGIPTRVAYFDSHLASKLRKLHGPADVVTATNVFAHVDDLQDLLAGVKLLLKKQGVFIFEVPYLGDFLEQQIFDTVYHEHLSYFSLGALKHLFERQNMKIIDVAKVATHGGSLRVFVQSQEVANRVQPFVAEFLGRERNLSLKTVETYTKYAERIWQNHVELIALLTKLKQAGKTIAGYGAPAKGNTLLNVFGIGPELIDYIVDDSAFKQGLYTPGQHIPVVSQARLKTHPPDYLLILAWNFAKPIMDQHDTYRRAGGKFILPIPSPKIV